MPRLGSLTQAPRAFTRFGANVVPMAGFGVVRVAGDGRPSAYPAGLRLGVRTPEIALGHSSTRRILLKAPLSLPAFRVAGVTRDSTGAALPSCTCDLFKNDAARTYMGSTVSDGSGNYSFAVPDNSTTYFVRFYLVGAPDRAGTTINNVIATAV